MQKYLNMKNHADGQKHLNFCVSSKAAVSLCITKYEMLRGIDVAVSFFSSYPPAAQRSPLPLQDSPLRVAVPQDLVLPSSSE